MKIEYIQLKSGQSIEQLISQTPSDILVFNEINLVPESIPDGHFIRMLSKIAWRHRRLLIVLMLESGSRWDKEMETVEEIFNTAVAVSSYGYLGKIRKGTERGLIVRWRGAIVSINFGNELIIK